MYLNLSEIFRCVYLDFTYNPTLGHFLFKIVHELWSKSAFIGLLLKTQGVRRILFLKPYKDY